MLWVRNGYVELTIILNHKNIQYIFTLPFLHTLPIITNKETAFSDLVIFFWLITMSYWFIHQIIRKDERFVVGNVCCHFKHYNFKHEAKSPDELNFRHLRSQVGLPFCVAYMCTCMPSVITQRGCLCSGQQDLQWLLGRGQGLWKGTWLRLWRGCARWWLQVMRKSTVVLARGLSALLCHAWDAGGLMERALEELSQPGLCSKRLGERGWVAWHKKETNPLWIGHEGHKDLESLLKTST